MVQEILGVTADQEARWDDPIVKGMMRGERSMALRCPGISGRGTQVGNEGKTMREMRKRK